MILTDIRDAIDTYRALTDSNPGRVLVPSARLTELLDELEGAYRQRTRINPYNRLYVFGVLVQEGGETVGCLPPNPG